MPSQTLQADLLATAPLRDSFVRPFYLSLLGGRFTRTDARGGEGFAKRIEEAACAISDDQIERLLGQEEWRGRLAAAWFVGLSKRSKFVRRIADLLISSEVTYAGQGYCIALGLIGNDECVDGLRSYLAKFLPLNGRFYDQDWALGALALITGSPPPRGVPRSGALGVRPKSIYEATGGSSARQRNCSLSETAAHNRHGCTALVQLMRRRRRRCRRRIACSIIME